MHDMKCMSLASMCRKNSVDASGGDHKQLTLRLQTPAISLIAHLGEHELFQAPGTDSTDGEMG